MFAQKIGWMLANMLGTSVVLSLVILPQRVAHPLGISAAQASEPVMATDGTAATNANMTDTNTSDINTSGTSTSGYSEDAEIPEEILRTEIITEARSPITGERLSAAEYAQLVAALEAPAGGNLVNQDIRYLVYLLQIRRALKPILPFID